ncbi:hypothetical protein Bca52824_086607 [Brassica carinata]|uniref:Uncharacterized protein n=1 Tax=Brassica carinata TaxID=52824 RepID=A0A8X7P6L4_BRACI|nr:hypothetical protein Bca52824_086607 [Brassica carinata]
MEEMLQLNGQKSIIIVSGANMRGWSERMINDELQIVRNAGVVQIQREISDSINIQDFKMLRFYQRSYVRREKKIMNKELDDVADPSDAFLLEEMGELA